MADHKLELTEEMASISRQSREKTADGKSDAALLALADKLHAYPAVRRAAKDAYEAEWVNDSGKNPDKTYEKLQAEIRSVLASTKDEQLKVFVADFEMQQGKGHAVQSAAYLLEHAVAVSADKKPSEAAAQAEKMMDQIEQVKTNKVSITATNAPATNLPAKPRQNKR